MRVQYPDQYASVLLNIALPNEKWSPERVRGMYGSSEIDLKFPTPIPVNITYQTAFVDDAGKLQIRKDVYGRDATMISLLKSGRMQEMENVVAHSQPGYGRRAEHALPPGVSFASNASSAARRSSSGCSDRRRRPLRSAAAAQQQPRRVITR